ncbi:MAG: hypothetical protein Q8N28_01800 [bacterium]|nr:hypothetical protein [bacterium]
MTQQKEFVFLYPIPEIINFEIKNHGWHERGGIGAFRKKYSDILNRCINERYRQKSFGINWVIFDDCDVSEVVKRQPTDQIIKAGLDFKTHTTEKVYPDQNYILTQLNGVRVIRIAGFHMWDCVEKLAKRAYEIGLDTLVDEDLTEFFSWRLDDQDFKTDKYPTYNPKKQVSMFKDFIRAREQRPWLWQNY